MRETIAFNNTSNEWVSRYSYTSSCFGWIKDHMVSSPVFTSTQQVLWKHDSNAPSNNSFYGCDPVSSGVSFSFNQNPSANKIYKSFSIESPDLLSWPQANGEAIFNTFIVNNGQGNSIKKEVVLNTIKNYGGILYGGVKGTEQIKSNSRVQPIGSISDIIYADDFVEYFGGDPEVAGAGAYVKISGPKSHFTGGDGKLVREANVGAALNEDSGLAPSTIIMYYNGGYFIDTVQSMGVGDAVVIAYRNINSDQPKGQFADVSVVFNTEEDFEVHAFNVDFEPTTLDHNS